MPRVAEGRIPAAPASERQAERWDRILDAAFELGVSTAYEQVQMAEVAKAADVAVGTLYRYFPSKEHLFASVYARRVTRFTEAEWPQGSDTDAQAAAIEVVGERLTDLTHRLLEQPVLCASMVRAASATYCAPSEPQKPVAESELCRAILRTLGEQEPDDERMAEVQMLVYSWWGVLVSVLSGRSSHAEAAYQTALSARRLLGRGPSPA